MLQGGIPGHDVTSASTSKVLQNETGQRQEKTQCYCSCEENHAGTLINMACRLL